eukprot:4286082-Prymnesium_polylepis.1
MIVEIVTDEWVRKWKLEKKLFEWSARLGRNRDDQAANGRKYLRRLFQGSAARVVAPHTVPGSYHGAHVPASAASVSARYLSAGCRQVQAAQGPLHCQGALQLTQPGVERARRGAEWPLARATAACRG